MALQRCLPTGSRRKGRRHRPQRGTRPLPGQGYGHRDAGVDAVRNPRPGQAMRIGRISNLRSPAEKGSYEFGLRIGVRFWSMFRFRSIRET